MFQVGRYYHNVPIISPYLLLTYPHVSISNRLAAFDKFASHQEQSLQLNAVVASSCMGASGQLQLVVLRWEKRWFSGDSCWFVGGWSDACFDFTSSLVFLGSAGDV